MNPALDLSSGKGILCEGGSIPQWGNSSEPARLALGGRTWDLSSMEEDPGRALDWMLRIGIAWKCLYGDRHRGIENRPIPELFQMDTPGLFLLAMNVGLIRTVVEPEVGEDRYPPVRRIALFFAGIAPPIVFHAAPARDVLPARDNQRCQEAERDYDKGEFLLYRAFSSLDHLSALSLSLRHHPQSRGNLFLRTPDNGEDRPSVSPVRKSWATARLDLDQVRISMESTINRAVLVTGGWGANLGFYLAAGTYIIGDPLWILEYQLRSKGKMALAISRDGASIRDARELYPTLIGRRQEPSTAQNNPKGEGIRCNHAA